tara:strand:- start:312 stop:692 length:381 start_codon:yes stop_codon:yes gene_type:complete
MAEFIAPEIIPFIWFGGIAITIYVFFHKFSDVIKEKFRQTNLTRRKEERGGNTDGQIDDLIGNAPRMLNEVNKIIAEQKASGVEDAAMKGLYQKRQMLELVTNNQEVINILGKPLLKKVLGFVKAI